MSADRESDPVTLHCFTRFEHEHEHEHEHERGLPSHIRCRTL